VIVAHAVDGTGTTWEIDRVLKGNDDVGTLINLDQAVTSKLPQVMRFSGDSWQITAAAHPERVRFLNRALLVSSSGTANPGIRHYAQQLRYFLPYLEHADATIAESTHAKFGSAPYAALKEIAGEFDRDKLISWIESHSGAINKRVALFVTLLGVCGDQRDARQIKAWLDQGYTGGEVAYLTALLTAHIEMDGEQAVRFVEETYIRDRDRKLGEIIAAIDALRTHGQAQTAVSRERIKSSFHLLLRERAPLAELVIDDFARWEDWSIADKLMQIHASGKQPWNNALILKYLESCPLEKAKQYVQRTDQNAVVSQLSQ
jgi:hypothetical protein